MTIENLRQFIRRQSDVKIALPDCLQQFDAYAANFMKAFQLSEAQPAAAVEAIVTDARNEATNLDTEHVCH